MKTFYITIFYVLFLWVQELSDTFKLENPVNLPKLVKLSYAPGIFDLGLDYPSLNSMNTLNPTKDTVDQFQKPRLQEMDNAPAHKDVQLRLIEKKYKILAYFSLGLLFISLLTGFLYFRRLVKESKKLKKENQLLAQEKEQFIANQVKEYDRRILHMLIVKAEYEEMKKKLKKEFGLGDDDFSIDSSDED